MSKKVKIIILIFVAILLVVISAIIFKVVLNKNIEKQKNTVLGYFSCINDKDYEKMYEFLSSTSKENISKEDFIKRNKNIYEGIDTTSLEIKIKKLSKLKENKKQVQVIYDENFFTSAGEVSFCNTLILVKENKEYKLNWNSKLIFPELEDDYKVRFSNLKSKRGSIFDRNGIELAHDGKISEIGIVPGKLPENKDEQIQKISELLDISVEKINSLLSASYVKDDTFVSLKKISKSNEELKSKLLEISGIMISNADGRVYELGEEAAHLIGYIQTINAEELKEHEGQNYTSTSVIGKSGLEYYYEQTLRGIDGSEIYIEDAKGKKVKTILCQEKKDGKDIHLTIDYNLQKGFYDQMKDDKGLFVAMDSDTGELLALVSTPTYNSNDFVLGMSKQQWEALNNDESMPLYNKFKQIYCPGSTFKPITAAIALTENVIDEKTEFGYLGTSWQKDRSWGDYYVTTLTAYSGRKNVRNAIVHSDNIFFAQCALKIGKDKFSEGLNKIGFGENIEFPIALKPSQYLNKDSKFTELKLANTGYGQADLLVNPIHMASIYSAFVNEGNMVKPYIELDNKQRGYLKENVFSKEAASIVRASLMDVVNSNEGTATDARITGMTLIGKTGTAELKKSKDDTESGTLGWFNCITVNRQQGNLVIVGMVENTQNNSSGGSHNVIAKIKNVLNNSRSTKMGFINVFSGPMKCGKSSTLIKQANNEIANGKNVKFFKPLMDDRFSKDNVVDRNGNSFPAINIEKIEEIENYDADVYMIDEFQFLQGEIGSIQKLVSKGKRFYIAGLNLTTEMKPFGKMGDLLCNSDNVKMMTARCECCNKEAIYTYCTVEKTGDILVGEDMYMPVCAECYTKLMNQKTAKENIWKDLIK